MKILITGNMGYVGPVLTKYIRDSHLNAYINGFDIGYFAHCLTGADSLPEILIDRQFFGDIRCFPSELLEGIDAVIHLAAISNDPIGNTYEKATAHVNFDSSTKLAKNAKEAGVRNFVFASSCSMYGFAEGGMRKENDPLMPLTAYARSKVATEEALNALADEKFTVTSLRFATACGWSPRLRLDLVLNDFVAGAIADQKIEILSDGTPWRPLIHVEDMARAIDWAMHRVGKNSGNFLAVNAGSNEWNYQVKDLATAVSDVIPGIEIAINKNAQPDKRSYQVDFELFRNLAPNHQPQIDLRKAIDGLHAGLKSMKFSDKKFRSSNLMRLKVLTDLRERGLLDANLRWSS